MNKTIVFDFDGVIHKYSKGWQDGSIYDEPNMKIINYMKELMDNGYAVAIVSTRNPIQICNWWKLYHFPMQAIPYIDKITFYNDTTCVGVFNQKIPAIIYIDDRGICFDGNIDHLRDSINSFKTYQESKSIIISSIVTMDDEITYKNVEIKNINTLEELDRAIQNCEVLTIIENGTQYKLNTNYIIYYIP